MSGDRSLDLRAIQCPINFVRTKLKLEAMNIGESLEVILDDGEPILSVEKSIIEEGQQIIAKSQLQNSSAWTLVIRKRH